MTELQKKPESLLEELKNNKNQNKNVKNALDVYLREDHKRLREIKEEKNKLNAEMREYFVNYQSPFDDVKNIVEDYMLLDKEGAKIIQKILLLTEFAEFFEKGEF
jgi:hypothetical protein